MPYYISDKSPDCAGWAVVKADGELVACQKTKQDAIDQALAISLSEDEEFVGELGDRAVEARATYTPPQGVRNAARRALEWIADGKAGSGFTDVGRRRASQLANGEPVSDVTVARMRSYFARHEVDKQATGFNSGEDNYPTPGRVAWDAWGGDAGQSWVNGLADNDDSQRNAESNKLDAGVFMTENKWLTAAYVIKAKLEGDTPEARALGGRELRTIHSEIRAVGDGNTFEGYAAVFNSPSEPLPFTEIIAPGAFNRSLKSRNRMMLLWNHNTDEPLASTRNGSLQLSEDERGLKVVATLPSTSRGNDIREMVKTGLIDSMSFGFSVKKDSWSSDGSTRTLQDVTLYEVSLVTAPAYEGTAGSTFIRELRSINPELLAESLEKLESGADLLPEQADAIREVVDKLAGVEPASEAVEVKDETDFLALAKAKLFLLEKGL